MLTKERFRLGMTFQEYLDQMVQNRDRLLQGLAEVEVRPEEQMVFRNLKKKKQRSPDTINRYTGAY